MTGGKLSKIIRKLLFFSVCVLPSLTPTLAKKKQKKLKILRFVQYFNLIILATDRIYYNLIHHLKKNAKILEY